MNLKTKRRVIYIFAIFAIVFMIVAARIAWVIVVEGDELRLAVEKQKHFDNIDQSYRGLIYDRNDQVLAHNKSRYKIGINRDGLSINAIEEMVKKVAEIIPETEDEINEFLKNSTNIGVYFTYIYDDEMAYDLINLAYPKLWVDKEYFRVYPNGSLAAQVLGLTKNVDRYDLKGLYGIESEFNEFMTGTDGLFETQVDRRKNELVYSRPIDIKAVNGYNVHLTIDSVIQYYLETALKSAHESEETIAAHGLVLNVKTGEILGMASYPTVDPNERLIQGYDEETLKAMTPKEYSDALAGVFRNRLISDQYELGSIIKLITTALALDGDFFTPDSMFDEGNEIAVPGGSIKCWKYPDSHPPGTLTQAVADSCNPVFVKIGKVMGAKEIYDGFESFGLFDYTDIELPAEEDGLFIPFENTTPMQVANMTFGHGASYTQIQVAMAVASLVNGGNLLKPQIVKKITSDNGELVFENSPELIRKVVSEITSQQMKDIMEYVVDSGSGKAVKTPGLRVGAKTGTSQKQENGTYTDDHTLGSFLTVAPMNDPEIMIYVVLDDPVNKMGSVSAGPLAKAILDDVSEYLEFPRAVEIPTTLIEVPDVLGMSLEAGEKILTDLGFIFDDNREGGQASDLTIINQYPKAGTLRSVGEKIILEVIK